MNNILVEAVALKRASEVLMDNPNDDRYDVAITFAKNICSVNSAKQLGVIRSSDDKAKFSKLISKFNSTSIIKSSKLTKNTKVQSGTINDVVVVVLTIFIENDDNENNYSKYRYIFFDANDYKSIVSNSPKIPDRIEDSSDDLVDSTSISIDHDLFISQINEYLEQFFTHNQDYIPFKVISIDDTEYFDDSDSLTLEATIEYSDKYRDSATFLAEDLTDYDCTIKETSGVFDNEIFVNSMKKTLKGKLDKYKNEVLSKSVFGKGYQNQILEVVNDNVFWYDREMNDVRSGSITEVEHDDIYIKAHDTGEEIVWPRACS